MVKKTFILLIIIFLALFAACDGGGSGPAGKIIVTVTLDSDFAGYPTDTATLAGYSTNLWEYPLVGGDGGDDIGDDPDKGEEDNDALLAIDEIGNKHVYVYVYGTLGTSSKDTAVLYKGESSASGTDHTITVRVEPGADVEYYVVAFYNYCGGDNVTNRLNRYDRYAIYNDDTVVGDDISGPDPYVDHAVAIAVSDETPVELSMSIETNWVLGKPKWENLGSQGRLFLTGDDPIPVP